MSGSADATAILDRLDVHTRCVAVAALDRRIPIRVVDTARAPGQKTKTWLRLGSGGRGFLLRTGVLRHEVDGRPGRHINGRAILITSDKALTKALVTAAGAPAPRGAVFATTEAGAAKAYFRALEGPACVKPYNGRKGMLVTTDIADPGTFSQVFDSTAAAVDRVLVEESLEGEVIRYFYVAPRAVAVKLSLPANVVGDGRTGLAGLIAAKNEERAGRYVPGHYPIAIDDNLRAHLAAEGRTLDSVPGPGERVMLRRISNAWAGGDTVTCMDSTHRSYGAVVESVCQSIPELHVAAIDMIVRDRTVPAAPGNHWILEVNSSPGVSEYHYPWEGPSQNVSGAIFDLIFGAAGR